MAKKDKAAVRRAVHTRIRRRVRGTQERPRLAIFRSLNHIYAQVIDDERGEREVLAALDDLGHAVDLDDLVGQVKPLRLDSLSRLSHCSPFGNCL